MVKLNMYIAASAQSFMPGAMHQTAVFPHPRSGTVNVNMGVINNGLRENYARQRYVRTALADLITKSNQKETAGETQDDYVYQVHGDKRMQRAVEGLEQKTEEAQSQWYDTLIPSPGATTVYDFDGNPEGVVEASARSGKEYSDIKYRTNSLQGHKPRGPFVDCRELDLKTTSVQTLNDMHLKHGVRAEHLKGYGGSGRRRQRKNKSSSGPGVEDQENRGGNAVPTTGHNEKQVIGVRPERKVYVNEKGLGVTVEALNELQTYVPKTTIELR